MPGRLVKFVSIAFVNLLAGFAFASSSYAQAAGDDQCLSNPTGEAPAGYHWRYRSDRVTKQPCWYLRPEGGSVSQAAPQNILPPAATPASHAPPRVQPAVSDAHAELRARSNENTTRLSAPPAPPPAVSTMQSAGPPVVAFRWPELSDVTSALPARPVTNDSANGAPREPSGLPGAAAALVPLVAAASAVPGELGTVRNLLAVTFVILMIAGITALQISRGGRSHRLRRSDVRYSPGPIWETTDDARIVLSPYPASGREYRPRFARTADRTKERPKKKQTYARKPKARRT